MCNASDQGRQKNSTDRLTWPLYYLSAPLRLTETTAALVPPWLPPLPPGHCIHFHPPAVRHQPLMFDLQYLTALLSDSWFVTDSGQARLTMSGHTRQVLSRCVCSPASQPAGSSTNPRREATSTSTPRRRGQARWRGGELCVRHFRKGRRHVHERSGTWSAESLVWMFPFLFVLCRHHRLSGTSSSVEKG
jgi:hypothetical protein